MTKLSCEEVISKLYVYLDKELDADTEAEMHEHIKGCRECYSRAEFEKKLKAKIAATAESKTPDDMRQRLQSLVQKF